MKKVLNAFIFTLIALVWVFVPTSANASDSLRIYAAGKESYIDPAVGSIIDISSVFDNGYPTDYEYLKISFSNIDSSIFKPVEGCVNVETTLPSKVVKTFTCKLEVQAKFYTAGVKTPYYLYGLFEGANSGDTNIPSPIPSNLREKGGTASIKVTKTSNNIPTGTPEATTTTRAPQTSPTTETNPSSTEGAVTTSTQTSQISFSAQKSIENINPGVIIGFFICICLGALIFIALVIFLVLRLSKRKGEKMLEAKKTETEVKP